MGFIVGKEILVVKNAPLLDPVEYRILNYDVSLRRSEAEEIEVELAYEVSKPSAPQETHRRHIVEERESFTSLRTKPGHIKVAFVGNPNCGKTSLFNAASGAREHVGNYSGVTVEAKTARYRQGGYTFELIDLPGTYSLASYSPEEMYIAEYLNGEDTPDVILNVIDTTNLERNLYLTVQLMETGLPVVVALNMYDELEKSGIKVDTALLEQLLGLPCVPTVGRTGKGLHKLFKHIIQVHEHRSDIRRIVDVRYPQRVEEAILKVTEAIDKCRSSEEKALSPYIRSRYLAIKLLEKDQSVVDQMQKLFSRGEYILTATRFAQSQYDKDSGHKDIQTEITDSRYGFVGGILLETLKVGANKMLDQNRKIDRILTHRIWGFPIFLLLMYLMFQATFTIGQYPMDWIEAGVEALGTWICSIMPEGALRDLLVDGILGGVGGVIVFLPNIVILYLFISLMEDTGYMARAAFIMDKVMHTMGLHGKSFIPMVMGFGCNVPAIMATRTIESRNSRMITMLVLPFMSCSARLPVYLLLAGAFFPHHAGLVIFVLYFTGILLAVVSALLFKRYFFANEDTPFVMELPPYRLPTPLSVLLHMWTKAKQYLSKMGGIILFASIIIWALGYFPRITPSEHSLPTTPQTEISQDLSDEVLSKMEQQEYSYIGRIGHMIEPVFRPLGYDWRMGVALLSGAAAKEIVVSTMGVLYSGDSEDVGALSEKLVNAKDARGEPMYDPVVMFSFMIFVLCYFPCIATLVAIGKESGSYRWAIFSAFYTVALAWVLGFLVTQIGHFIL